MVLAAATAPAATVYSNPVQGIPETIFYSAGGLVEIGDQIQLGGTARLATQATVQFYNPGDEGSFDAVLRFYEVTADPDAPVGAPIGSATLTSQVAPAGVDFTLAFALANLLVPTNLIFTVEVQNTTLDLGLDLYPTPATGSSDPAFLIVRTNSFSKQAGFTASNLFFELEAEELVSTAPAAETPEPGTLALAATALAAVIARRRSSRR